MKGFDALVLALVPEMVKAALKRPIHIALSYDEEIACRGAPPWCDAMAGAHSGARCGDRGRADPACGRHRPQGLRSAAHPGDRLCGPFQPDRPGGQRGHERRPPDRLA